MWPDGHGPAHSPDEARGLAPPRPARVKRPTGPLHGCRSSFLVVRLASTSGVRPPAVPSASLWRAKGGECTRRSPSSRSRERLLRQELQLPSRARLALGAARAAQEATPALRRRVRTSGASLPFDLGHGVLSSETTRGGCAATARQGICG